MQRDIDLIRKILLRGRSPSQPLTLLAPPTDYPDQPGHGTAPVALEDFMPPPGTRFADETLRFVLRALDIDLRDTPAPGAAQSEFDLARDYLDLPISGVSPGPFNGDLSVHHDRLWSLLHLLFEHPEFQRM